MILDRIAVMLAYMIPGYVLYKKRIISDKGEKDIGKLLIYIILPAAVLPFGDDTLRLTVIILAAAPVGSNVAVYAQIYGGDCKRAVREVVLSTLLCVLTMPLVIGISERILQNIP